MLQRRGLALISTLLVVSLLAVLLGAFVQINRANLGLLGGVRDLDLSQQARTSGLAYALMRLEGDTSWGIPSGTERSLEKVVDVPALTVWEGESAGTVHVVGLVEGGQALFQLQFQASGTALQDYEAYAAASVLAQPGQPASWTRLSGEHSRLSVNYLNASAGSPPLAPPQVALRALPARCANLQVCGQSRYHRLFADVTVRKRYFLNASLLAQKDLGIAPTGEGKWHIDSADPFHNRVISNERILGPAVTGGQSQISFNDNRPEAPGTAESRSSIILGGALTVSSQPVTVRVAGGQDLGDGANDETEQEAAGALAGGTFAPNSAASYNIPPLTTADLKMPSGPQHTLNPGHYRFVGPDTVHYWSGTGSPSGPPEHIFTGSIPDSNGSPAVQLGNHNFVVPHGSHLIFPGSTRISGDDSGVPYVAIGYSGPGTLADEGLGAVTVTGDLTIEGAVVGSGAVVAQSGGLTLQGKSALAAPTDTGVTLFADGPIHMEPVSPLLAATASNERSVTWDFLRLALHQYDQETPHPNKGWADPPAGDGIDAWLTKSVNERETICSGGEMGMSDGITYDSDHANLRDVRLPDSEVPELMADLAGAYPVCISDPQVRARFDTAWNNYMAGLDYDGAAIAGRGVSVGRFVRLQEYLKRSQARADANGGTVPGTDLDVYSGLFNIANPQAVEGTHPHVIARQQLMGMLDAYCQAAQATNQSPSQYLGLSAQNPFQGPTSETTGASPLDGEFKGLIYTKADFYASMGGHRFTIDGALVAAGGALAIDNASLVRTRYNPDYMDRLLKNLSGGLTQPLEVVYWSGY